MTSDDRTDFCEYCSNDDHSRCRRIRRRQGDIPSGNVVKLKVCQCPCDVKPLKKEAQVGRALRWDD